MNVLVMMRRSHAFRLVPGWNRPGAASAPPGDVELDLSHCQPCAEWLSRHRVTAQFTRGRVRNPRRAEGKIRTCQLISGGTGPSAGKASGI